MHLSLHMLFHLCTFITKVNCLSLRYFVRSASPLAQPRSCRMMTSLPAVATPRISISDAFDGGNGVLSLPPEYDPVSNEWKVFVDIKKDPFTLYEQKHHSQYFSFRATIGEIQDPITIRYLIRNAGQVSFPRAWNGSTTFVSTNPFDPFSWVRKQDTIYKEVEGTLTWTHTHEPHTTSISSSSTSVYFSYFPPYSYQRHLDLIAFCSSMTSSTPHPMSVYSLGQTLDGRELDCIQIGHGPRIGWIIHRQHPGETMAEFYAEGLILRLLGMSSLQQQQQQHQHQKQQHRDNDDVVVRQTLELYTLYIVPNMNPDGSVRGFLRTNAGGQNLNREWTSSTYSIAEGTSNTTPIPYEAPTLQRSPEVYHVWNKMMQTGCDVFLDVHGDEELPFNFVSGAEGCSNWSRRMEALQGAFLGAYCRSNPDMQKKVSYDPELPGQARTNVASNQVAIYFDCLAFTLEMPFKDCKTRSDIIKGWSPEKCQQLGASVLEALVHVHPFLRDYKSEFWNDLEEDDLYVKPSSHYD